MRNLLFFSDYIQQKYGKKLYRIPIDLALGCPNRENRFGPGCIFCAGNGSRARHLARNLNLHEQIARGIDFASSRYGAEPPYIAYFQSFTNTFSPVNTLRKLYSEALNAADFRVVIIATRPDALPEEVLDYLAELNSQYELWVELGVQTANDRTSEIIRRGHYFNTVKTAVNALAQRNIRTACHLIAGLPGENMEDFIHTAQEVAKLPFSAVKFHQLQILKNTELARRYQQDHSFVTPLNEYAYADILRRMILELPDNMMIMRLVADADPDAVADRFEQAVADDDVFADLFALVAPVVGLDDDAVVGAADGAVGDGDVAACVDGETVAVAGPGIHRDAQIVDRNVVARLQDTAPERRIEKGDVLNGDAVTFADPDHFAGAPRHRRRKPLVGILDRDRAEGRAVAGDGAAAADDQIVLSDSDDEVCSGDPVHRAGHLFLPLIPVLFGGVRPVLGTEIRGVVVLAVRTCQQKRAGGEVEPAAGFEVQGAGEVGPGGKMDDSAGVDGALDRGGVERFAVACRAVVADVSHGFRGGGNGEVDTEKREEEKNFCVHLIFLAIRFFQFDRGAGGFYGYGSSP